MKIEDIFDIEKKSDIKQWEGKSLDNMEINSIIKNDNLITFFLKEKVLFSDIENRIKKEYSVLYNHYDEETFFNYKCENKIISCIAEGYVVDNKCKAYVYKIDIRFL